MPNTTVKHKQTIGNVAILHMGTFEAMYTLALLNNLSLTESLESGRVLLLADAFDADAVAELKSRDARPALAIDGEALEGIGYWRIGVDFIVS